MRKLLAGILVLVLLLTAVTAATASTGQDASMFVIRLMLKRLSDEAEASMFFNFDESIVFEDDDGDVILVLESELSMSLFLLTGDSGVNLVSLLWQNFNELHGEFSNSNFMLLVKNNDNYIYYADAMGVMNVTTGEDHKHQRKI